MGHCFCYSEIALHLKWSQQVLYEYLPVAPSGSKRDFKHKELHLPWNKEQ
jgi:hypothetical protein